MWLELLYHVVPHGMLQLKPPPPYIMIQLNTPPYHCHQTQTEMARSVFQTLHLFSSISFTHPSPSLVLLPNSLQIVRTPILSTAHPTF